MPSREVLAKGRLQAAGTGRDQRHAGQAGCSAGKGVCRGIQTYGTAAVLPQQLRASAFATTQVKNVFTRDKPRVLNGQPCQR